MNATKKMVRVAVIAALYATLTVVFHPLSFGPLQIRFSEALTVLPFIEPLAIPGLFLGCIIANLLSPYGLPDILGGSFCTLIAAFLTFKMPRAILAPLPPIVVNAFGVGLILHLVNQIPYWPIVIWVGIGEVIACYILGYPLLRILMRWPGRFYLTGKKHI